jgi:hypothetical protein
MSIFNTKIVCLLTPAIAASFAGFVLYSVANSAYKDEHKNDDNSLYVCTTEIKSWESVQGVDGKVPLVGCKGDDNEEQTSKFLINYTNTIPIQRETN